jgi:kynureninase
MNWGNKYIIISIVTTALCKLPWQAWVPVRVADRAAASIAARHRQAGVLLVTVITITAQLFATFRTEYRVFCAVFGGKSGEL